jgi:tetratricopeptide (TPR) repeat protein
VLNNIGNTLARIGESEGIDCLERALAISREIGDRIGEARAAHNLADAHLLLNGPIVALDHMVQSLEVQRRVGYSELHAAALNNLGETYIELGRLDEAVACLQDSLPIFASNDSPCGIGQVLLNLGRTHLELGHHEASGDRPNEALTLEFLGQAHIAHGNVAAARGSLSRALMIFNELGDDAHATNIQSLLASMDL